MRRRPAARDPRKEVVDRPAPDRHNSASSTPASTTRPAAQGAAVRRGPREDLRVLRAEGHPLREVRQADRRGRRGGAATAPEPLGARRRTACRIRMVGPEEIREIEPHSAGIKGIFSPRPASSTGARSQAYADDVSSRRRDPDQLRGRRHPPQGQLGLGEDHLRRDHPDEVPHHLRRCTPTESPRCPGPTRAHRSCHSGATTC